MVSENAELLAIALRGAEIARDVVMPLYESALTVELKADRTPVTIADKRAEEAIRAFLQRECPAHGILGEEFGEAPGDGRHRWILDPIDGTKSYIHHVPLFGTLIALERDGEPVVGVIACHAIGETVAAAAGEGAWLNSKRVTVSTVPAISEATVTMTSASRMFTTHPKTFTALVQRSGLLRGWGDCYGYLMVATGRAEAMLDPEMSIWDAAALYPVVTEAGGRMTTWAGEDRVGDSVAASNGLVHNELLAILALDR
ncbi:MAG: histidinol phosphate phosphatase [Dehalococcoidia bacterium]|nr:histidinol phosphate phosphatase [Dehalococcoidia bacterium]